MHLSSTLEFKNVLTVSSGAEIIFAGISEATASGLVVVVVICGGTDIVAALGSGTAVVRTEAIKYKTNWTNKEHFMIEAIIRGIPI